jgi:hypothetical protein
MTYTSLVLLHDIGMSKSKRSTPQNAAKPIAAMARKKKLTVAPMAVDADDSDSQKCCKVLKHCFSSFKREGMVFFKVGIFLAQKTPCLPGRNTISNIFYSNCCISVYLNSVAAKTFYERNRGMSTNRIWTVSRQSKSKTPNRLRNQTLNSPIKCSDPFAASGC